MTFWHCKEWIDHGIYSATTLCVSAVFAVVRCMSVCLYVTFVYCIQKTKILSNFFLDPLSPPLWFL